jgi:hypothetical protein
VSQPFEEPPKSWLDRALANVPRALASHLHIIFLMALGVYLIVLPLAGVPVSAKSELIGGNYTNVTSDIGACIAAGGTLALLAHSRHRSRLAEASHKILADLYRHHTGTDHPDAKPKPGG